MTDVSVVTGGAGGMGIAIARRFLGSGDTVVLADMDADRLRAVADDLGSLGAVVPLTLDVTHPDCGSRLAEAVSSAGRLRAVAHTAGLSPTMGSWERVLTVNLVGSIRVLDGLEPLVAEGTAAVCIASQAGHLGDFSNAELNAVLADPLAEGFLEAAASAGAGVITEPGGAYGWSKWALRQEVIRRAQTWGPRGARITSLSPGIIETPMGRQEFAQQPMMAMMVEMTPLQRMGTADEIASVVEFLCSPGASFVTGVDLLVDGGSTEQLRTVMSGMMAQAAGGEAN